jgi:hypothetical protein
LQIYPKEISVFFFSFRKLGTVYTKYYTSHKKRNLCLPDGSSNKTMLLKNSFHLWEASLKM